MCIIKGSGFSYCYYPNIKKMRRNSGELSSCLELFCTSSGSGSVTKRKITFIVKAIPTANEWRLRISVPSRTAFYTDNCNGVQIIKIVSGIENTSLIQVDSCRFRKDSYTMYLIRKDLGIGLLGFFFCFCFKTADKNIYCYIWRSGL